MGQVLVTGATGFIGSHLATDLLKRGGHVRCLVRKSSPRMAVDYLQELGAEIVLGDLTDERGIRSAIDGISKVFHLGGGGRIGMPDDVCRRINVDGTRNLLAACAEHGTVERFVHVSTCGVMGSIRKPPANETLPYNPEDMAYARAKTEAEKVALSYEDKVPVVVVRFPGVYGKPVIRGELAQIEGVTPVSTILSAVKHGKWRYIGSGKNLVHWVCVDDVVRGLELAAERGRSGEIYIIADTKPVTMEETVRLVAGLLEVPEPRRHVPIPVAKVFARLSELRARVLGGKPAISMELVKGFLATRAFDITKARRELGYEPMIGLEEGLRDTVMWYEGNGYLGNSISQQLPSAPIVKVIERRFSRLRVQASIVDSPRHEVYVEYSISGLARVIVDDKPFAAIRVVARDKTVDIPLGGEPPRNLQVRFDGTVRPRLDFRLNGVPITRLL